MTQKSKTRNKKSRAVIAVLAAAIIILTGVIAFSGFRIITSLNSYNKAKDFYEDLRMVIREKGNDHSESESARDPEDPEHDPYDFSLLLSINQDAVGYIKARGEGDVIDYPLVQGSDNSFYLDHLFNGEPNSSGAIFADAGETDFPDGRFAIIYGHNMRSGAGMFRCLDNYRNEDYFREHDLVDIHVRENHYLYRVFSAIETKTSGFVYSPDFEDHFHENIETAIRESLVAGGMSPDDFDDDSKVLALSTCMAVNYTENRFVVFLVRENELS